MQQEEGTSFQCRSRFDNLNTTDILHTGEISQKPLAFHSAAPGKSQDRQLSGLSWVLTCMYPLPPADPGLLAGS
jgi:hypothetical protein